MDLVKCVSLRLSSKLLNKGIPLLRHWTYDGTQIAFKWIISIQTFYFILWNQLTVMLVEVTENKVFVEK